ncbi:MAG: Flp family type IVb pilin [Kordiimonadales bacterium]|nr:MAG: Flp family type IVb pilin [Kordiimonadales bacterium]
MFKFISKFRNDDKGATAIEYGLIAALIAIALIAALQTLGGSLSTMFSEVSTTVGAVDTGGTPTP